MTDRDLDPASARAALTGVAATDSPDEEVVERHARLVWNTLTEPGDRVATQLIAVYGALDALRALRGRSTVAPPPGVTARELAEGWQRWTPRLRPGALTDSLAIARRNGIRAILPGDAQWPVQLDDLGPHAPLALWVRGQARELEGLTPSVAFVGARAASSYGEHVAADLAAAIAGDGVPVVSGAAYGIDAAAHRAALAVGGRTVALMAGGVERSYPAGNSGLIDRIAERGAVVSEVPCGGSPTKWRFLQRNRLISALSDATVVVEAGWRSGSLNTAGHAAALGRPIGAVPGPVTSATSAGCHRMLRELGAVCITSSDDVRELIGMRPRVSDPDASTRATPRPATDDRTRVIDALSPRVWREVDDVARRSGMAPREVEAVLGLLRLEGAAEHSGGLWRRARASAAV
ncbi:DNA-processing protein DprA [Microbacterium sp. BWT-B31]|uniref:DNA-processing protein DprA n=1 Tax=Microbacterium sp. BWT-B31 TaxID=3232072 RepID=UPI0035297C5C